MSIFCLQTMEMLHNFSDYVSLCRDLHVVLLQQLHVFGRMFNADVKPIHLLELRDFVELIWDIERTDFRRNPQWHSGIFATWIILWWVKAILATLYFIREYFGIFSSDDTVHDEILHPLKVHRWERNSHISCVRPNRLQHPICLLFPLLHVDIHVRDYFQLFRKLSRHNTKWT